MSRCLLMLLLLSLSWVCRASLENELEKFFDSYAEINNVSGPDAYKGQSGGYYTGGTLFARTPPRVLHPLSIQLPQYSAGCGGIDLFTGGFSYINSDQLVKMMRNIVNNAQSLAFAVGFKSVMPMVANVAEQHFGWAQNINQFDINSCETAAIGLGMIWPQVYGTQDVVCRAQSTHEGQVGNFFDARLHCNQKGAQGGKQHGNQENVTALNNMNLAWKAIKKSPLYGGDNEFAEFLMSLSGTLIFSTDKENNLIILDLPSLVTHSNLLQTMIYGGEGTVYKCDTHESNGCLVPSIKTVKINSSKSLGMKVSHLLNDMVYAMENDEALKPAQKALLNATSIPVYRILNVYTTYAPATKLMDIHYYAELIAYDLLYSFLVENIKAVEELAHSQLDLGNIGSDFFVKMQKARQEVDQERAKAAHQANQVLSLIEKAKTVEKEIASQYSAGMTHSVNVMQH